MIAPARSFAADAIDPAEDSYQSLLRRLRLRPLRDRADCEKADEIIDELFGRDDLDPGESDYLETLLVLYQKYEEEFCPIVIELVSPLDRLKHLLDRRHKTRADLGRILGDDGTAAEIMAGVYQITAEQEQKIADHFGLPAGFLKRDADEDAED